MRKKIALPKLIFSSSLILVLLSATANNSSTLAYADSSTNNAFAQASQEFGVPVELLKTICYIEGRLSNHAGHPSVDNGFGCMHLVQNKHSNTLNQAAQDLNAPQEELKNSMSANIRGGSAVLHDLALSTSPNHTLPVSINDWYGVVAAYSGATSKPTALMYADSVFKTIQQGFSAQADDGTAVTLTAKNVVPNVQTASIVHNDPTVIPAGCTNNDKVDYPGAVNCIPDPKTFDCNFEIGDAGCNYFGDQRPSQFKIDKVVIHDIEGTVQEALNIFQNPNNFVSTHYIVDTNGTIYQFIHDKDTAFQAGNRYYNNHSIGIEHAGFDATGFLWYNATEYLASAKLTAFLAKKYDIPADHDHIVSHGTIPSPSIPTSPNHKDPGPYWLWDYYLNLVRSQGVPPSLSAPKSHVISLHPLTDQFPLGFGNKETPANFNFFYLYNGPSTASGLIPQETNGTDITDTSNNVEPAMSFYYISKTFDPAGSGNEMYQIWYGEEDQTHLITNPTFFAHAKTAWLAVPPGAALPSGGTVVSVSGPSKSITQIYGRPTTSSADIIGDAPSGAIFVSALTVTEDGTSNLWYEINYNHRQAWVPANETTVLSR
jgi:hypothetical protein